MGNHGTNVWSMCRAWSDEAKILRHEIELKQRPVQISVRPNLGSGPIVGMKAMLALFSLPVELLGVAIVFISVMAGMLAAAAE